MTKNPENAWLGLLIFKAMWIPDIHKSPGELLNSRKYRTNLPMIDFSQKVHEPAFDKMIEKCELVNPHRDKELPKLDVGTHVL